jgi:predicted TIM-barrel fold metal-dependent hydrolase
MKIYTIIFLSVAFISTTVKAQEDILLKDYDPVSIYNIPKTKIAKAKFPVVDFHSHPNPQSEQEIREWVKTMDKFGVAKSIILTYQTGKSFDSIVNLYSKYGDRFELWCGFDFTGYNEKGWSKRAVKELERCYKMGARGVGELGDKGLGFFYSKPTPTQGMHADDERMKPLWEKCGELGMPVSIHVADPMWMYEPMDVHNDGLMNAYKWRIDTKKEGLLTHGELIATLENAVREHPKTTFIACHFANCSHDLEILGSLLGKYDNMYADISARFAETAAVPRYTKRFYEKYQDKLVYGTDMGNDPEMYELTFRILESEDEHFYDKTISSYHWSFNGLGLSDEVLRKVYNENAKKILD